MVTVLSRGALALAAVLPSCAVLPVADPLEDLPVFPAPPEPPRVQFLMSIRGSQDVEPAASGLDQLLFGAGAQAVKPIVRPVGVAVRDGMIYVLDAHMLLVYRIDLRRRKVEPITFSGRKQLQGPMDMFMAPGGNTYIADRARRQVLVFNSQWELLRELGPFGDASGPVGVTAFEGRVFIADAQASCVRVIDEASGKEVAVLGGDQRERDTALRKPTSVAVDEEGYLFVVDAVYQRILTFDRDLKFVRQIGEPGNVPGFFGRPKAVTVLDRTVWVLDSLYENCQILDMTGKPLMWFGGGGFGPGQLYLPRGMWIGTAGIELFADRLHDGFVAEKLIVITSWFGRKVSFYALGRSRLSQFADKYVDDKMLPQRPIPLQPGERRPGADLETETTTPASGTGPKK